MECQSKELVALRSERTKLKEALEQAHRDKEELVQRWIEEKSAEADRLNKHNDLTQRWQHVGKQLKKHSHRERGKRFTHLLTDATDGAREASQSVTQEKRPRLLTSTTSERRLYKLLFNFLSK
ncbi:uncharacterized protein si:ch1073-143l10.2 [Gambusia affinis]|uniref:uncharacterized protein si:ch1073-143l10.2 n=1 Tax=Gambusia affinis TaxID=33528 RepID=UPI001CDB79BE|nr:uncharacterized protein si:ch1073-143l10.2 [Gambusia affinis]